MIMNKVLFIDDESYILQIIERKLAKTEIQGYFATEPMEGLKLLEEEEIDVVFTDLMIPDTNGLTVVEEVHKRRPGTVVVILSGNAQASAIVESLNTNKVYKYLVKPWRLDDAGIEFLRDCLAEAKRRQEALHESEKLMIDLEDLWKFGALKSWELSSSEGVVVKKTGQALDETDDGYRTFTIHSNRGPFKLTGQ